MEAELDGNTSLIIFLVVFVIAATVLKELVRPNKTRRKRFRSKGRENYRPDLKIVAQDGEDQALASASEQLRRFMAADFKSRALLNRSETQIFRALDAAVIARNSSWQVMAQVSLGEFLSSPGPQRIRSHQLKAGRFRADE